MNKHDLATFQTLGMIGSLHALRNPVNNTYWLEVIIKSNDQYSLYSKEDSAWLETMRGEVREFRTFQVLQKFVSDCGINCPITVHQGGTKS